MLQRYFTGLTKMSIKNITCKELVDLIINKEVYLIDVRNKNEIKETGEIPGSYNVPINDVKDALSNTKEQFKAKYGFTKPDKEKPIIFVCKCGARSLRAANTAEGLGYKKVFNYTGGWLDWKHNQSTAVDSCCSQ